MIYTPGPLRVGTLCPWSYCWRCMGVHSKMYNVIWCIYWVAITHVSESVYSSVQSESNDKSHGEERIWEMTSGQIMSIEYHLEGHNMSQSSSGHDINLVKWDPLRLWKVLCKWIPHVERTRWCFSCLDKLRLKSQALSHNTQCTELLADSPAATAGGSDSTILHQGEQENTGEIYGPFLNPNVLFRKSHDLGRGPIKYICRPSLCQIKHLK